MRSCELIHSVFVDELYFMLTNKAFFTLYFLDFLPNMFTNYFNYFVHEVTYKFILIQKVWKFLKHMNMKNFKYSILIRVGKVFVTLFWVSY